MICRHCCINKVCRQRGLCFRCYYTPCVRERYSISSSKFSRRALPDFNGPTVLPSPTDALPGTPEKIVVLNQRAMSGLLLHHPHDARLTLC